MLREINSLHDLSKTARGRRLDLGLSQAELAQRARVSRQWVNEFEAGKPSAEIRLIMQLLAALDLHMFLNDNADSRATGGNARGVDLDVLLERHRRP